MRTWIPMHNWKEELSVWPVMNGGYLFTMLAAAEATGDEAYKKYVYDRFKFYRK